MGLVVAEQNIFISSPYLISHITYEYKLISQMNYSCSQILPNKSFLFEVVMTMHVRFLSLTPEIPHMKMCPFLPDDRNQFLKLQTSFGVNLYGFLNPF